MSTLYGIGELISSMKRNAYYEKKYKVQVSNYKWMYPHSLRVYAKCHQISNYYIPLE